MLRRLVRPSSPGCDADHKDDDSAKGKNNYYSMAWVGTGHFVGLGGCEDARFHADRAPRRCSSFSRARLCGATASGVMISAKSDIS